MLVVISPAKKLNENCNASLIPKFTLPSRLDKLKKNCKHIKEIFFKKSWQINECK